MLYYSDEARNSAIEGIDKLMVEVNGISGERLDYATASDICRYLAVLKEEIEKERAKFASCENWRV